MDKCLRALATCSEDPSSIPSLHMAAHSCCYSNSGIIYAFAQTYM